MLMHEIELYLNKMNNVLINEDINQHNVQYLLQIKVQETKYKIIILFLMQKKRK